MNNSNLEPRITREPWYRVGMVWMVFGLPAVVVVASLVTVGIAHKNAPAIIPAKIDVQAKP